MSESVVLIISILPSFSQALTLKEAFETDTQLNKEVKYDGAFCKRFKLPLDRFFSFFAKHRKSVEKSTQQKKNRGHQTSKIVKSTQSYRNGHFLIIVHLVHALNS